MRRSGVPRLAWIALLLTGCASQPVERQVIDGVTTQSATALQRWQVTGRLGVNAPQQSGSGAFDWHQDHDHSEVSVRGPAGMGGLQLNLQGTQLTFVASDGSHYDATAALAELERQLGVALPLPLMSWWLRGIAAPATGQAQAPQWLNDSTLLQAGWRVDYQQWSTRDALRLPIKLNLQRDAISVVIKVQRWTIDE